MAKNSESEEPLFETRKASAKLITCHRIYAASVLAGILLIWTYRALLIHASSASAGMFGAELWFGLYWIITQSQRWNPIHRRTFKHRLAQRYGNEKLPRVDVFVCTADPEMEPPTMVINTVLSLMAYDYPPEKLSVYLSDDAGSEATFYALLEASRFAREWIPYCRKFNIEPRSPEAYFREVLTNLGRDQSHHLASVKEMFESMERRIELAGKLKRGSKTAFMAKEHRGFSKWESFSSRNDHDTILHILIDGREAEEKDSEGWGMPSLVYLAREKRPQHFHNFKAGAMNALIRVSSEISNGPIILNVDCDMYSNNSQSIKDALCFLVDEEKGREIAYVQFPQKFYNLTRNEIYGGSIRVISEVEFHGLDGCGGPAYIGTGCFHRRDTLCGKYPAKEYTVDMEQSRAPEKGESTTHLEERIAELASCTFEKNTLWGREMGVKYGCLVEDMLTGLSIQSRGWKSVYFNPKRTAFLGLATTTLEQTLVQHKRWSEGDLQIFLSRHNPVWIGLGRISVGLMMGYSVYFLWALNCFATLYYSVIPSLYLLKGIALFPQVSSAWFLPFAYVIIAVHVYSFYEYLSSGGTVLGWWNEQRMWLYKRTTSYLFATIDTLLRLAGYTQSGFVLSSKVSDEDSLRRYEQEKIEFGTNSTMFTILSTLAAINLVCLSGMVTKVVVIGAGKGGEVMVGQIVLCVALVSINLPLYNAAVVRKDKGRIPTSITHKSIAIAISLCATYAFLT
ncbi:LOW QUALITY PROTEIN: cellulose synthase-like protein E1 [Andrographis paniculata]|uniref:LOW QUALITY PROTEIN: cellulose synthase-like protein E1 n=1 Tax=Andrographis paniculata TaxID=175694 RepID=UPI0021E726EB|nr:LOW QUALITY PROTEIN: cellulose synthase-like protein E1 [Andrographis paniculata]